MAMVATDLMPCELSVDFEGKNLKMRGNFHTILENEEKERLLFPGDNSPCKVTFVRNGKQITMLGQFDSSIYAPKEEPVEKLPNPFGLTPREIEVLKAMPAAEFRLEKVAEMLIIAETTVKTHVNNLYGKTHTHKMAACFAACVRAGYFNDEVF